jgi:hypothetical protein
MYGDEFTQVRVDPDGLEDAAAQFAGLMAANRNGDDRVRRMLKANHSAVRLRFPEQPWRDLLRDLAEDVVAPAGTPGRHPM